MSLQDWAKRGWIKPHRASRDEIAELFGIADRDLEACQTPELVTDWQFNIAYNAALQLATAALAAAGYQASRTAHHLRVIRSLEFTLGLPTGEIDLLDTFRKKRNEADYERAGVVADTESEEMVALARRLRTQVEVWIARIRPDLLP